MHESCWPWNCKGTCQRSTERVCREGIQIECAHDTTLAMLSNVFSRQLQEWIVKVSANVCRFCGMTWGKIFIEYAGDVLRYLSSTAVYLSLGVSSSLHCCLLLAGEASCAFARLALWLRGHRGHNNHIVSTGSVSNQNQCHGVELVVKVSTVCLFYLNSSGASPTFGRNGDQEWAMSRAASSRELANQPESLPFKSKVGQSVQSF